MDINELKKLMTGKGEKIILVEDGEPTVVLVNFADYQKLKGNNPKAEKGSAEETFESSDLDPLLNEADFEDENDLTEELDVDNLLKEDEELKREPEVETEKLDSDIKLEPEAKKDLSVDDLPF